VTYYKVKTMITQDTSNTNVYQVTIQVTWPPINSIGIKDGLTVRHQEMYRYPTGCIDR